MAMNVRLVGYYQALSRSGETHEHRRDAKDADRWRPRTSFGVGGNFSRSFLRTHRGNRDFGRRKEKRTEPGTRTGRRSVSLPRQPHATHGRPDSLDAVLALVHAVKLSRWSIDENFLAVGRRRCFFLFSCRFGVAA